MAQFIEFFRQDMNTISLFSVFVHLFSKSLYISAQCIQPTTERLCMFFRIYFSEPILTFYTRSPTVPSWVVIFYRGVNVPYESGRGEYTQAPEIVPMMEIVQISVHVRLSRVLDLRETRGVVHDLFQVFDQWHFQPPQYLSRPTPHRSPMSRQSAALPWLTVREVCAPGSRHIQPVQSGYGLSAARLEPMGRSPSHRSAPASATPILRQHHGSNGPCFLSLIHGGASVARPAAFSTAD